MANPTPSLDQIVKGAPAPNTNLNQVAASAFANPPRHTTLTNPQNHTTTTHAHAHAHPSAYGHPPITTHDATRLPPLRTPRPIPDPTHLLPSSPPQIYLNLLILEASLRSQYLTLRARRRQNTFVLLVLLAWILYFTYCLWLRPRPDGIIGGSPYWLIDRSQKVMWGTGVLFAILFWATGQWEHGMRWPRRWLGIANRGLRGYNAKIVVIRGSWVQELVSWLSFIRPFSGGLWGGDGMNGNAGSSYHLINTSASTTNKQFAEEDIAKGGDCVKLLLLPKPFSAEFRENWEVYRTEYWERENERRRELRVRVRARQREIARGEGGWLWWTGWRGWKRARGVADVERSGLGQVSHGFSHAPSHSRSYSNSLGSRADPGRKRRASLLTAGRDGSASRSSSRSSTPTPDLDERLRPLGGERERRPSTGASSTRSDSRRKKTTTTSITSPAAPGTAQSARQAPARLGSSASVSASTVPGEVLGRQGRKASGLSVADNVSDHDHELDLEAEPSGFDRNGMGRWGRERDRDGDRQGGFELDVNAPSA